MSNNKINYKFELQHRENQQISNEDIRWDDSYL